MHMRWLFARCALAVTACLALATTVSASCPGNLTDSAHVAVNPTGNDYDVWYTNDTTSVDFFPDARAAWVRDTLPNAHNRFIAGALGFQNPHYSATPNDTCIFDSGNIGQAPSDRITLDAPSLRTRPEPYVRFVLAHELFHHVQFGYINFNQWPSWGKWCVEGTARAMEDKLWTDNDQTPGNTFYVGEVNGYLAAPDRALFDRSYDSALFWTYMMEQLGSPTAEPGRGANAVQRFWALTSGHSPDGVRYLREAITSLDPTETLESLFRDFAVTNYTHDLDVSRLPDPSRFSYVDETTAGGGTPFASVARQSVPANGTASGSVNRWASRYYESPVTADQCQVFGLWIKTKDAASLHYAVVGMKRIGGAEVVTNIYYGAGSEYRFALVNPVEGFSRLGVVVIGMNNGGSYDLSFGAGSLAGSISDPTDRRMAFVGRRDDPGRFQARLRLTGPAMLTPDGSGNPSVQGLDPSLFTVTLRSVATGASHDVDVVQSAYVDGEYWLVMQAPEIISPADGDLYDLVICVCDYGTRCGLSVTSPRSVLYAERSLIQMHVVDRSYSMHWPQPPEESKIAAAKIAAQMYINAGSDGDRMGVVSFTGNDSESPCDLDAQVERPLVDVATGRADLLHSVHTITEDGWTSIGDGVKLARDQVLGAAGPADALSLVLFSDGMENEGDFWAMPNPACGSPAVSDSFDPMTGFARGIRIDTIAFGPDTNQGLLQNISAETDGDYYAVSTDRPAHSLLAGASLAGVQPGALQVPNRLANVYRTIEESSHDQDRLFERAHNLTPSAPVTFDIEVTERQGGGIRNATFVFNWNLPTRVTVELRDAAGDLVDASSAHWTIYTHETNKVYVFDDVLPPGKYAVQLVSSEDVQVLTMLSGRIAHGVDLDVELSQSGSPLMPPRCQERFGYLRGLPVAIIAGLSDMRGGIEGLTVKATVTNPDGSTNRLTLHDDGAHGDNMAGDGIYANLYTRTPFFSIGGVPDFPDGPPRGPWGSYSVVVTAEGTSHFREPFTRSQIAGFHLTELSGEKPCDPDEDRDGMPDRWETLYGLDPRDPTDAGQDPDVDSLANLAEFEMGTLPRDPDTDGGGEGDGSEVRNGRDPLYDVDDQIAAIIDCGVVSERIDIPVHLPQPRTNIVHFPVNEDYGHMRVWRRDPGATAFAMVAEIDLAADPSGVYYDAGLLNGQTYEYYLVAVATSGAWTPPSHTFTGTPKADPLPPLGWLQINWSASKSDSFRVRLQFDTSDDAVEVRVSEDPALAGARWQPIAEEAWFELANPPRTGARLHQQGDPLPTSIVYAQYRDAAGNVSIAYTAAIVVDENGDADGDGIPNNRDPDDDDDGLTDEEELTVTHTDPFLKDSDGDGVLDGQTPEHHAVFLPRVLNRG